MAYPIITWKEENLNTDLNTLADYGISLAESSRNYYRKNSRTKSGWAKGLRITAIVSGALGGLLPILSQIFNKGLDPAWATVAVTIAITAIGFDRFFGFSNAWMRFITTEMKIESKIQQFRLSLEVERFSWAGKPPAFQEGKSMLVLVANFIKEVLDIVQDETNTWMVEFQNVIQKFNEEMNVKAEASKLGGINIVVENGEQCGKGVTLYLEGQEPVTFFGLTYSRNNLYPKMYKVSVKGTLSEEKDGKVTERSAQAEALVNVLPAGVATVTLSLK